MKWFILLALAGLATAARSNLGDRIVDTEEECQRILKLNDYWQTSNFHEQTAQYVDLYFMCLDSLNEDKYAYIDKYQVDLSWYPGENEKFPVLTSEGEKYVTKPPPRKPKEVESMKAKLGDYLNHFGTKLNPLYMLTSIQSDMGQVIIDKQVECEVLAVYLVSHPEDKDTEAKHNACMTELNCAKERFMELHNFKREQYPEYFPILYKRRGTMVKTPPKQEPSVCETPDSPEGNKKELDKWLQGIEVIGGKMADFGVAGTDFIQKLAKKGMGGGDKMLTKEELDQVLAGTNDKDAKVTIEDDNGNDDRNGKNIIHVLEDTLLGKMAELEAKGVDIAHNQLENVKPVIENIRPAIEKLGNFAAITGAAMKKFGDLKVKPTIEKGTQGLTQAELTIKDKSKSTYEGVKAGMNTAGGVAKSTAEKAKREGSVLIEKLKSKADGDKHEEGEQLNEIKNIDEEHKLDNNVPTDNPHGWLGDLVGRLIHPQYLPTNYGDIQVPGLLNILRDMGRHGENGQNSVDLIKLLKSVKEGTRNKAKEMHLTKLQVKQSAEIVKSIMHMVLMAGGQGFGPAKHMALDEIALAKAQVNKLVDMATEELLNDYDREEKDNEKNSQADEEDKHLLNKDEATASTTKQKNTKTIVLKKGLENVDLPLKTSEASEDFSKQPETPAKELNQATSDEIATNEPSQQSKQEDDDTLEEEDDTESSEEVENHGSETDHQKENKKSPVSQ